MLKGDKLRDLMLFIHLNNEYGRSNEFNISDLKKFIGYSSGGMYNALDNSGYFVREGNAISLTQKGKDYVKKELMTSFKNFHSISYLLFYLGFIFLVHWYLYTQFDIYLFFDWQVGAGLLIGGFLLRFTLPRLTYFALLLKKKFSS